MCMCKIFSVQKNYAFDTTFANSYLIEKETMKNISSFSLLLLCHFLANIFLPVSNSLSFACERFLITNVASKHPMDLQLTKRVCCVSNGSSHSGKDEEKKEKFKYEIKS